MIIMYMNEADIPWIITILPYLVRSLNWLCLWALPSPSEDFDSFSWKRLDVILYSCFVVSRVRYKSNFNVSLKLQLARGMHWNVSVWSLFPLTTSLVRNKWGGTFETFNM